MIEIIPAIKMDDVTERSEGFPVELAIYAERESVFAVRAWNEGGHNCTNVNLVELAEWMRSGPKIHREDGGFFLPLAPV